MRQLPVYWDSTLPSAMTSATSNCISMKQRRWPLETVTFRGVTRRGTANPLFSELHSPLSCKSDRYSVKYVSSERWDVKIFIWGPSSGKVSEIFLTRLFWRDAGTRMTWFGTLRLQTGGRFDSFPFLFDERVTCPHCLSAITLWQFRDSNRFPSINQLLSV